MSLSSALGGLASPLGYFGPTASAKTTTTPPVTPLTLYVTSDLTPTDTNRAQLSTSTATSPLPTKSAGGALDGGTLNWYQYALGTGATTSQSGGTIPPPTTTRGAIWPTSTLTGKKIVAGVWQMSFTIPNIVTPGHNLFGTLHARAFVLTPSSFTQIGSDLVIGGVTIPGTTRQTFTFTGSLPAATFATPTARLYVDLWLEGNITHPPGRRNVAVGAALATIITPGYR